MARNGIVVVFDFDRTIIDGDSDRWVVTEMGVTDLFLELRHAMPWTSLMNRMVEEIHSQGKSTDEIADCLKRASLHPRIIAAIKSAHAFGCDLKIVSDSNKFYIGTILKHHGLLECFSEIYTNPAFVDEEGRLHITPYNEYTPSPHICNLCPSNICKGSIIDQIRASTTKNSKERFIYLGDGKNDFCPSMKLEEGDHVMPRKNFPLWELLRVNAVLIKAQVHEWGNGKELEEILLRLINPIVVKEDNVSNSSTIISPECKFETASTIETVRSTCSVPQ